MLKITVLGQEHWDNTNQEFIYPDQITLELEHSLVALSKWESKWKSPFLGRDEKTTEQVFDYIKAMTLTPNISDEVYKRFSQQNLDAINEYINDPMTATWFNETGMPKKATGETITAELIYYWLTAFGIPLETQFWHLNRLFTLIKVTNLKNQKPKKMSREEQLAQQRRLNEERQKQYNTTG